MKITRIKAKNFKSYKNIDVTLNNLNYVIGGNATGKSNFVNILKFFYDIIEYGIDDAILLQGGIKYLISSNSEKNSIVELSFEISYKDEQTRILDIFPVEKMMYLPNKIYYTLCIKPHEKGEGYKIKQEKLNIIFDKFVRNKSDFKKIDTLDIKIEKDSNKVIKDNINVDTFGDEDEIVNLNYVLRLIKSRDLLLNNFFSAFSLFYSHTHKIKIYNFDVNLLKSPSNLVARSELEDNGANLVNIIQQLLKSKEKKAKLTRIIKRILPFVDDIKVENNVNKSLYFKVKESYNNNDFPSYMLSDGTVNILAVIVALYFQEDKGIIILEEPERNIHPKLLSILVSILEEVSSRKQIIITTHNPYIVKEANLNDVILVSRSRNGISKLSKPINDMKVMAFLENDLGIEDLFVDGILK